MLNPEIPQNDPGELLEVFDAHGIGTGQARSRAAIHLNGDWHQAFHCWIVRQQGREVVLQRRAVTKDTFAGCWDAAAAGHWRFGETPEQAAREIAEELGLQVSFAALRFKGTERGARHFANGLTDREHHRVYLLELDLPLRLYRPDPAEVMGVAAFSVTDVLAVATGRRPAMTAREAIAVQPDGQIASLGELTVGRSELVPYSAARLRRMLGNSATR